MVTKQPLPDENQGQLFEVSVSGSYGRDVAIQPLKDPTLEPQEEPAASEMRTANLADRRQRAALLLSTLDHLGNERESTGYTKWDSTPEGHAEFEARFKGRARTVRAEKEHQRKLAGQKARETFVKAFKLGLDEHSQLSQYDIDDEYTQFHFKFASPKNAEAASNREKLRRQLRKTLDTVETPATPADTYEVVKEQEPAAPTERELELLDSRQRLIALRDDDRAGFLPSNHNEKTQAFTLLSFMDEPGGIHNHLAAVAKHQEKVFKKQGAKHREAKDAGKTSVVSILNEYGDHVANAIESMAALQKAKEVLDNSPNPQITLAEALEDNPEIEAGFNEILRYVDLLKLRETGEAPMPFDPLGPKRNEDPTVLREGQNKRLDDPYTGTVRSDAAEAYVDEQHREVKVITARHTINAALDNEAKSYFFWSNALQSIRGPYRHIALSVLDAVQPETAA